MNTKDLRSDSARTALVMESGHSDRFSRNQRLDRPFLSQSPGYATLDEVTWRASRVSDPVRTTRDGGVTHAVEEESQEAVSVDEIVGMLADCAPEQRFQAAASPGRFVACAREVEQRIAGAPLK